MVVGGGGGLTPACQQRLAGSPLEASPPYYSSSYHYQGRVQEFWKRGGGGSFSAPMDANVEGVKPGAGRETGALEKK